MSGAIEFACPYCERVTRVPSTFAGKQGKCPGCQRVIEVPNPAGEDATPTVHTPPPLPAPTSAEAPPAVDAGVANTAVSTKLEAPLEAAGGPPAAPVPDWQQQNLKVAADAADADALRPCPMCGEQIKAVAKKCKFCGEFLDKRLRGNRGAPAAFVMRGVLASRWTRLAAWVIDFCMCELPAVVLFGIGQAIVENSRGGSGNEPVGFGLMGLGTLVYFGVSMVQWVMIASRGQTPAKAWLGLKIVKTDGTDVDFVYGVLLRNWVYNLIGCVIPYIGVCIKILGCVAIFADDQRCLHDHIASTRVIEAGSDRR